jgi:hypothetical protein
MSRKKKRQVSKGTGKRYTSDKPRPQAVPLVHTAPPPPSSAEKSLRSHISSFGLSKRFFEQMQQAYTQYMGPDAIQDIGGRKTFVFDEEELPGFQEWFYFDYVLPSGERIIDLFEKEEAPHLSVRQQQIMQDWIATNRLRLLEAQTVEPGVGETMLDLLSGEILHLNDISFSYNGTRWSVLLARQLLTEGRWHFTGGGLILNPLDKPSIFKYAKELWTAYQENHPQADIGDFYRDHSLDLYLKVKDILADREKPQALFTAEGHPAEAATALFTIPGDAHVVDNLLDNAIEFVYGGEQTKGQYTGCLLYHWLLRGRSSVPEAIEPDFPENGLILRNSWTLGPGEPDYRTLGDIFLCEHALTLSCISRVRLEAGKQLLSDVLGPKIIHQQDSFQDLRESWEKKEPAEDFEDENVEEKDLYPDESDLVHDEVIERETRKWLETPNQEGITPRQMAQTAEGREVVKERLKAAEYIADQALREGRKPPMRIDIIRKELGL